MQRTCRSSLPSEDLDLQHGPQEFSYPFAFFLCLESPVALIVVAVPIASRSSGAETTMKAAALAAPDWPTPARSPVLCLSATTGWV
jgi:hypothetical protein